MKRFISLLCLSAVGLFSTQAAAQLFDEHPVYNSYRVDTPPVIDGILDLNEWAGAGEPIVFNETTNPDSIDPSLNGHPYGGEEDLSFQFRSMWVAPWDLYFLVEINDNIAMDEAHEPGLDVSPRPWQRDQLEFFIDGDQLTGGNIRWWQTNAADPVDSEDTAGDADPYGKFAIPRPYPDGEQRPSDGNTGKMSADPEEVGLNGIIGSGIATSTGVNENYFVELHISMLEAMEGGLFDGTQAGEVETMVPNTTALKFSAFISDNDNTAVNVETDDGRTHGAGIPGGGTTEGPIVDEVQFFCTDTKLDGSDICGLDDWWRSDKYPNLLMRDTYVPGADCDFDGSGTCDVADLNELMYTGLASGDTKYDLDGSGVLDLGDRDAMLREIESLPGDANTDGTVDAQDLNAVGSNWQMDGITSYADGDFNGDGRSDATDLNDIGLFWTKTANDFNSQAAASASAVPEPAGMTLILMSVLGLATIRRRK